MHVETSYFLSFQNIVGTAKNIWNRREVLLSTIFYTKSSVKPYLLGTSLTCNIFSKSWFLCCDKSHIKKSGDVSALAFALSKNKLNFRSSQTNNSFTRYELNYRYFWRILLEISGTLFAEHISVAASWNYIIISTLSFKHFLNNILDSQ